MMIINPHNVKIMRLPQEMACMYQDIIPLKLSFHCDSLTVDATGPPGLSISLLSGYGIVAPCFVLFPVVSCVLI